MSTSRLALSGQCRRALLVLSLIVLLSLFVAAGVYSQVNVVKNNVAVAVIVVPRTPLEGVSYAAKELQYHIEQATGAKLEIINEPNWDRTGPAVVLGDTLAAFRVGIFPKTFPPNGYTIRTVGDILYIAGDDNADELMGPYRILHNNFTRVGTLLGVYELLKTKMGVKWLWPGKLGEVIPKHDNIRFENLNITSAPPLIHTRIRDGGPAIANPAGWTSTPAYIRYTQDQTIWLRRQGIARSISLDMHHAFAYWWDKYSETNPEYFNLLPDGTRRSNPMYHGGSKMLIGMCVSEPTFWQEIVKNWQQRRTERSPYIDSSENDCNGSCVCERCMSWDVPHGKLDFPFDQRAEKAKELFANNDPDWIQTLGYLSDRYAKFYLAVQNEARKVDPDATVMGFAYANYAPPPLKTKLNDKIIIGIVPSFMFPWTKEKIADSRKQWNGWAKTGCRMMLRPNYTLDGANMPIFYARKLGEDLRFAAKNGLIGTDFDSLTGQWATQGPNLYVLLRMQMNPELTVNKVLDEYYSGFGPAAKAVKEYFGYWEKISDSITDEQYAQARTEYQGHWSTFVRMAGVFFTPEVIAHASGILDKAAKAAEGDSICAQRVEFLAKGLEHVKLTLATQEAFVKYKSTADIEPFRAALERLDTFRADNEDWNIANMGFLSHFESMTWDRKFVKEMTNPGVEISGTWKFQWDPDEVGLSQNWQAENFDDSTWLDIVVGTNWEAHAVGKAWEQEHGKPYDGIAWYRKEFTVTPEQASKNIRLVFGAVDEACKVFLNGVQLLDRPYPYQGNTESWQEAFGVDIKAHVRTDRPNKLAVLVEDRAGAGGIWRPVWIVTKD